MSSSIKQLLAGLIALASALISGCDNGTGFISPFAIQEMKPGVTTRAEAQQRMGAPSAEYTNADGSVTLEYNRQPQGVHTHMLTFGTNDMLLRVEQVLTDENYAKIDRGLDKAQVQRILGKPGKTELFKQKGEEVWDWRVEGSTSNEEWHFYVHFSVDSGLVVNTTKMMLQRG